MSKKIIPPECDSCGIPIWNPEWWDTGLGMCGVCTTGESETLHHSLWEPPKYGEVDTDWKYLRYWNKWYKQVYLPTVTADV